MQAVAIRQSDNHVERVRGALPYVWLFRLALLGGLGTAFVMGGPVMKAMAIAGTFFALWGDLDGAVRHVGRVIAFAIAIVLTPLGVSYFGPSVAAKMGWSAMSADIFAGGATIAVVLLVGEVLSHLVSSGVGRSRQLYSLNRIGGAAIGAAEGLLLVTTFCWAFSAFEPAFAKMSERIAAVSPDATPWISEQLDRVRGALAEDQTATWLSQHNPLGQVQFVDTSRDAAMLMSDPDAAKRMVEDVRVKALLEEPAVKRHMAAFESDPQVREWVKERDISKIMASPQVQAMVNDAQLRDAILFHWNDLRAALSDAAATSLPTE